MQYINKTNKKNFTHNAFTMIEMVFVIVILGILAAVAVPKLSATRTDAEVTKGRADIASIRSAIVTERQARLIKGISSYIPNGTGTYTVNGDAYNEMDNGGLFGGVLTYPITNVANKSGKWSATAGSGTYKYRINNVDTTFTYYDSNATTTSKRGMFICVAGAGDCDILTQ